MEMRFTFNDNGNVEIESISILEDLWHDYQFFKTQALKFEQAKPQPADRFVAKRYRRAAAIMLVFYVEGVLNRWLKHLLPDAKWKSTERESLPRKLKAIQDTVSMPSAATPTIDPAKQIRDALAHLKPGGDLELYDRITGELLEETEATIRSTPESVTGPVRMRAPK